MVLGISIYVVTQRAHDYKSAHDTKILGSAAIDHTIEKFLDDFVSEHLNPDSQAAREKFEQTVCTLNHQFITIQYTLYSINLQ